MNTATLDVRPLAETLGNFAQGKRGLSQIAVKYVPKPSATDQIRCA